MTDYICPECGHDAYYHVRPLREGIGEHGKK